MFEGSFENLSRKFKFHENMIRITSILLEDLCRFTIISRLIILVIRKDSDKSYRHNKKHTFHIQ